MVVAVFGADGHESAVDLGAAFQSRRLDLLLEFEGEENLDKPPSHGCAAEASGPRVVRCRVKTTTRRAVRNGVEEMRTCSSEAFDPLFKAV